MSKITRIITILTIATIMLLTQLPGAVNALPMPPMPGNLPSSSGGGSSSGSSSVVKFQPYTVVLNSTDGTTIGNISAQDYYLAKLWAEKIVTIDGLNYTVRLTADLESVPTAPMLDILPASPAPGEMNDATNYSSMAAFNITRYSKAGTWVMKTGTVHLYITPQAEALSNIDASATFYLIKNDTMRDLVYPVTANTTGNATTIDVLLWYEPQSPSNKGIYTLAGKTAPVTVEANATLQTDANQPTTTENVGGSTSLLAMGGVLVLGIAIGLIATLLFGKRAKKQ